MLMTSGVKSVTLWIMAIVSFLPVDVVKAALPGQWFPIGPAAIEDAQTSGSGRVEASGRATVIAVNPENPQDVWLGTATGGVWNSRDAGMPGMSWRPMTDDMPSLSIGALLLQDCGVDRCNIIYIGTGENNIRRHTYYGAGLIKGAWSGVEFPSYVFSPLGTSEAAFGGGAINNILLDEGDLLVTVSIGRSSSASQSTVQAFEPANGYGVHRSPDDGITWELVAPSPENAVPTDLVKSPGGDLYAGFMEKGLFKLSDMGNQWCPLHPGVTVPAGCPVPVGTGLPHVEDDPFDHVEIEWSPADSNVAYITLGKCPSVALDSCVPHFYKTTNGGGIWSKLTATPASGIIESYTRYTHALRAHPSNRDIIWYGGLELWRSTNGGNNFSKLGTNTLHPDHQDIVYADPEGNLNLLYSANDGGFFFSLNGGQTWLSGNYDLQTVQLYSIAADTEQEQGSEDTDVLLGGAQDNGVNLFSGSRKWDHVLDADGGDTFITNKFVMYGSQQQTAPWRTTTGAALGNFGFIGGGLSGPSAFYPPYLQHPITKTIYFATDRLYRFTNPGWSQVSPIFDPDATEYPFIETKNVISSIALARTDANRIYVGHYNGAIWRTNDGGPCNMLSCWTEIGGPNVDADNLPNAVVSSIEVDPTDPDRVYVTYSGFGLSGGNYVYTSDTGGDGAWQQFSDGLPNLPANVIKVDPEVPAQMWLGSDRGIFFRNETTDWQEYGPASGLPNVPVYDLAIDKFRGRVYAATFGRGAYMLTSNPAIYTYEGWMGSEIWDILLYGKGFTDSIVINSCTVDILLQDGQICASGDVDAYGDTVVKIGNDGTLVTDNQFVWSSRPVIAACLNGNCVGGTNIQACLADPNNLISSVRVKCGGQIATARVSEDCPQQDNPPSTIFAADGEDGGRLNNGEGGSFDVLVTLASTSGQNGGDRAVCGTRVEFEAGDSSVIIGDALVNAINNATSCQVSGVTAFHPEYRPPGSPRREDDSEIVTEVRVAAPGLTGGQLMLSFRAAAGQATGLCFSMRSLGIPALKQLALMQKRIVTGVGGAAGGSIVVSQRSGQGTCTQTVTTQPGDTANVIAQKIGAAFMDVIEPGSYECESRQNAYDMIAEGDKLISVSTKGISFCLDDEAVGLEVGPMDLDLDNVFLPPTAKCKDVSVPADENCEGEADINDGSVDSEDGFDVELTYSPAGPYPLGKTEVTLTVRDSDGFTDSCQGNVMVSDITPPAIKSLWPDCLWTPKHKFHCLKHYGVLVTDNCPGDVGVTSAECSSSDGGSSDNCVIKDGGTVCVQSEREWRNKDGRTYTLSVKAEDDAGNEASLDIDIKMHQNPFQHCDKA